MSKLISQDDLYTIMQSYDDRLDALGLAARAAVPISGIIMYPSFLPIPEGWLNCNGAAFDPTIEPFLFNVLGDNHAPTAAPPDPDFIYIIKT